MTEFRKVIVENIEKHVPVGYRLLAGGEIIKPGDLVAYADYDSSHPFREWGTRDAFEMWARGCHDHTISNRDRYRLIRPGPQCPCGKHDINPDVDVNKQHRKFLIENNIETDQEVFDQEIKVLADTMWEDS